MSRTHGQLAIVLHTHMPYVEGFGTWPFGEEWLWVCVAESYLRLEQTLATAPLTVGVTPVLADQFERMRGSGAGDRMLAFFADTREHVFDEEMRAFAQVGEPDLIAALELQRADYRRAAKRFEELGNDLNALLASFARDGAAELIGGPATHAILPLMATDFGVDLQLRTGLDTHAERFGVAGQADGANGIWLPECAYAPGVERRLARAGVSHFCIDQSEVHGAESLDNLEPVALPGGLTAVPIDWRTINLVWHEQGYPGAGAYRSSFKRTVHALMPWNNNGDAYDADAAREQARRHADDFLTHVRSRLDAYEDERGHGGLCVFAVDTELLGHWWYEGPWWLQAVCDGAAEAGVELTTLSGALGRHDPVQRDAQTTSWGLNKDLSTWDSPEVADFAWQTRAAELELFDLLGHASGAAATPAALRAARELLAMQASDWAFIAKRRTAGDYAHDRYVAHLAAFKRAAAAMSQSTGSDGTAAHGRSAGEGTAAEVAGLAPGLTNQTLSDIRCAY